MPLCRTFYNVHPKCVTVMRQRSLVAPSYELLVRYYAWACRIIFYERVIFRSNVYVYVNPSIASLYAAYACAIGRAVKRVVTVHVGVVA